MEKNRFERMRGENMFVFLLGKNILHMYVCLFSSSMHKLFMYVFIFLKYKAVFEKVRAKHMNAYTIFRALSYNMSF